MKQVNGFENMYSNAKSRAIEKATSSIDDYIPIILWNKNMWMLANNYEIPI